MTRSLLVALVPVLVLTGCFNYVEGGPEASETRSQKAFSRVRIENGITASFKPGEPSVTINSQQKVLENLETVVREGQLVVRLKPGVKVTSLEWTEVVITGADVTELKASGGSTLNASALAGDAVKLEASGGSHIGATGQLTAVNVEASGGSTVTAHLGSASADVEASGGSVVEVTATAAVTGEASGGSRIRVAGGGDLTKVEISGGSTIAVLEQ